MHEASVHAWTPSCDVTLTVCWEQSSEFSKTALEFRAFFFVQRLLPERLQQRFCGSNKHEHIRSDGHDELNDMMNSTIEVIEISARTQASAGHLAAFVIRYALSIAGTLGKRPALRANPQATGTANRIFPRAACRDRLSPNRTSVLACLCAI